MGRPLIKDKSRVCKVCFKQKVIDKFLFPGKDKNGYRRISRTCVPCYKEKAKQKRKIRLGLLTQQEKKEFNKKHYNRYKTNNYLKYRYNSIKRNAKYRGIKFSISFEDYCLIEIPKICPILGIKLKQNSGGPKDNSPSLDRIDTSKGYVKNNLVYISYAANRMKSSISLKTLEKMYWFYKNLIEKFSTK